MPRAFNSSQRVALFLASDGKCSNCGVDLEPGWHADHVQPWSAGGETDVRNGQALCPKCNLKKGATVTVQLREWQKLAFDAYNAAEKVNFVLCATPGSGKTMFASFLAKRLLDDDVIDRVAVVAPTKSLKVQWADDAEAAGLHLQPVENEHGAREGSDFHGSVVTYQQVTSTPDLHRMASSWNRTLVIFDEIHHAGEERDWGDKLRQAFEHATRRLLLTGTPWRSDNNPIPWADYHDGRVQVDFDYGYGRAVKDGVCRPVNFRAYDGKARWQKIGLKEQDSGVIVEAELGDGLSDEHLPDVLRSIYNPQFDWMPKILAEADRELNELRETVPDAGGLVIADSEQHARAYQKLLAGISGEAPVRVISADAGAHARLDAFRDSRDKWLVAIRMVSEGVNIPRLAVGVYASRARTPLFFRQVVGRFIRQQPHDEHGAALFMPAIPALMRHAAEIESELRHAIEEPEELPPTGGPVPGERLFDNAPISAEGADLKRVIRQGEAFTKDEIAAAEYHCRKYGIPLNWVVNVAGVLRDQADSGHVIVETKPPKQPSRHRYQKQLAARVNEEVKKLANLKAQAQGRDRAEGKDYSFANADLNKRFGIRKNARPQASTERLEEMLAYLRREVNAWSP